MGDARRKLMLFTNTVVTRLVIFPDLKNFDSPILIHHFVTYEGIAGGAVLNKKGTDLFYNIDKMG